MFAYCLNAPVNMDDQHGELPAGVKPMQVAINDGGSNDKEVYNPSYYDEPSRPWSTNSREDYNKPIPAIAGLITNIINSPEYGMYQQTAGIYNIFSTMFSLLSPATGTKELLFGCAKIIWFIYQSGSGAEKIRTGIE